MTRMSTARIANLTQNEGKNESTSCDRLQKSPKSVQSAKKLSSGMGEKLDPPQTVSENSRNAPKTDSVGLTPNRSPAKNLKRSTEHHQDQLSSTPPSKILKMGSIKSHQIMSSPQMASVKSSPKNARIETSNLWDHSERRAGDDSTSLDPDDESHQLTNSNGSIHCFDISSMPAARLLSPGEKKLCISLRMTPSQYISIKGLMIKVRSACLVWLSYANMGSLKIRKRNQRNKSLVWIQ